MSIQPIPASEARETSLSKLEIQPNSALAFIMHEIKLVMEMEVENGEPRFYTVVTLDKDLITMQTHHVLNALGYRTMYLEQKSPYRQTLRVSWSHHESK